MNKRCWEYRRILVVASLLATFAMSAGELSAQTDGPKPAKKRVAGDPYFTPALHQSENESKVGKLGTVAPTQSNPRLNSLTPLRSPANDPGESKILINPDPSKTLFPPVEPSKNLANVGKGLNDFAPPNSDKSGTTSIIRSSDNANAPATRNSMIPLDDNPSQSGFQTPGIASRSEGQAPSSQETVGTVSSLSMPGDKSVNVKTAEFESFEPGQVLAIVGGEPIFVGDVLFEANSMLDKFMPGAPAAIKDKQRPELIKRLLPKFVDSKLLYVGTVRGLPEGVDMKKVLEQAGEEFDNKALPLLLEQYKAPSAAVVDANLRLMGHSLRKMRDSWSKDQLTKYFLGQQLNIETEVTHAEMLEYYRDHFDDYAIPARARWEQVMVRFDKFPSRSAAKKAIVKMGNQIVHGANFEAVAKRESQGFEAAVGGQHDWTTKGSLVLTELDEAIFSLPIGELSEIIETRDGCHIVRVQERNDATRKPFLEAQVKIKETMQAEKREAAFQEHLSKLRREIPVEMFENELESATQFSENYTLTK